VFESGRQCRVCEFGKVHVEFECDCDSLVFSLNFHLYRRGRQWGVSARKTGQNGYVVWGWSC